MKPMSEMSGRGTHKWVSMSWSTTVVGFYLYPTLSQIFSPFLAEKTKKLRNVLTKFLYFSYWYSYTNSEDQKSHENSCWTQQPITEENQVNRQTSQRPPIHNFGGFYQNNKPLLDCIFHKNIGFMHVERRFALFGVKKANISVRNHTSVRPNFSVTALCIWCPWQQC